MAATTRRVIADGAAVGLRVCIDTACHRLRRFLANGRAGANGDQARKENDTFHSSVLGFDLWNRAALGNQFVQKFYRDIEGRAISD